MSPVSKLKEGEYVGDAAVDVKLTLKYIKH
jgi:hypothetical protein